MEPFFAIGKQSETASSSGRFKPGFQELIINHPLPQVVLTPQAFDYYETSIKREFKAQRG
jgi:hypothetical protein